MKLRTVTDDNVVKLSLACDRIAAAIIYARAAGCPSLLKKLKSARKSAEGAWRHMRRAAPYNTSIALPPPAVQTGLVVPQ